MVVKTSGIITKDATVAIGEGLPNTTSMYHNGLIGPREVRALFWVFFYFFYGSSTHIIKL